MPCEGLALIRRGLSPLSYRSKVANIGIVSSTRFINKLTYYITFYRFCQVATLLVFLFKQSEKPCAKVANLMPDGSCGKLDNQAHYINNKPEQGCPYCEVEAKL